MENGFIYSKEKARFVPLTFFQFWSPMLCLAFLTHCEYFELNLRPATSLLHFLFQSEFAKTIFTADFTKQNVIVIELIQF